MNEIKYKPNDIGASFMEDDGIRIEEMIVGISGKEMSVYHTEVMESLKG